MAGGKETPRQKMIGMMYLVLTALLALNVSKSVLDAFVAIEENIQKANIVQVDRGNGFYMDVKSEIASTKGADQMAKKKKLEYVLKQMDAIDEETAKLISKIDEIKVEILKKSGESVDKFENNSEEAIMWVKGEGVKPTRMHLMAVQAKDQYDVPMHEIVGEDLKNPTGLGKGLWDDFNNYRNKIVELSGSYAWGEGQKFEIKPTSINDFEDNMDLMKKVKAMVEKSKANLKEDKQVLIDLYMMLTKKEKNKVHDQEGIHWIGMTFDHSPLVAAVASLSSMQQDILSARALALAHWKSKVTTGEYSFNKIMPLAYGPEVANANDDIELRIMMAAFDSDNMPTVTISEGATVSPEDIKYEDGQGIVKVRTSGGNMTIKGTVSIKNKSGVKKTEPWTKEIVIMKPQGSIELPELNVLYRGYPNKVDPTASGYPTTVLTGTNCSVSKSGNLYVASPGAGKEAFLTVSGKTADGKTVQLKKVKYRVSNLPDPELYWGAAKNGEKASKAETRLFAKYPPEIPLNASFTILSWECQVPGASGRPPSGSGGDVGAASGLIRAAKPGSQVSFICKVKGPDGIVRTRAGAFKI